MKKKFYAVGAAVAMMLMMTACGDKAEDTQATTAQVTEATTEAVTEDVSSTGNASATDSAGPVDIGEFDGLKYINEDAGFMIDLPEDWEVAPIEKLASSNEMAESDYNAANINRYIKTTGSAEIYSAKHKKEDGDYQMIMMVVHDGNELHTDFLEDDDIDAQMEWLKDMFIAMDNELNDVEVKVIKLAGEDIIAIDFNKNRDESSNGLLYTRDIYMERDGYTYAIYIFDPAQEGIEEMTGYFKPLD